jgi:hypothetical protein
MENHIRQEVIGAVMEAQPGFFKQLISKNTPESSMRFALVFTYIFCVLVVFGSWSYVYITVGSDLGMNIIGLTTAVIAIATGGKVAQNYSEAKEKKDELSPKP